jgi:nucleotidyltransferase substrate binding protein (TIGR01987 family)
MQEKTKRMKLKNQHFLDVFDTFKKVIEMKEMLDQKELSMVFRDSVIQRFEYTYETCWKLMKSILEIQGVPLKYPREIFREALALEWIKDYEVWERIVDARNLTSHTFSEQIAIHEAKAIIDEYLPAFEYFKTMIKEVVDEIERTT